MDSGQAHRPHARMPRGRPAVPLAPCIVNLNSSRVSPDLLRDGSSGTVAAASGRLVIVPGAGDAVLWNVDRGLGASRRAHARPESWCGERDDGFYRQPGAARREDEHADEVSDYTVGGHHGAKLARRSPLRAVAGAVETRAQKGAPGGVG